MSGTDLNEILSDGGVSGFHFEADLSYRNWKGWL